MTMHNRYIRIILALAALLCAVSCHFANDYTVDFDDVDSSDPLWFKVTSSGTVDLSDGFPAECFMPGGDPANEYQEDPDTKTTSTNATITLQSLLDFGYGKKLVTLSGTYMSTDIDGSPIKLSGKVILPADGKFKRFIVVSHYTIGSDIEAPSRCFPLEAVIAPLGYAMIFPDYIGYGVTASRPHPYLVMDLTAKNVTDMYFAVKPFLEAAGVRPEHDDIFLMGYSQGGATTMEVQRELELNHPEVEIRRNFAGGGPYDIVATYDNFVTTNVASYPCAVPLVLQGMKEGAGLDLDLKKMTTPLVYEHIDEWFNSKKYPTSMLNQLLGTKVTSELISEEGRDRTSDMVAKLYKVMTNNSIAQQSWTPEAPVYMFHSMDDDVVLYLNAQLAKNQWKNSNITYNFGHYGGHIKACVRFIFTVQNILGKEKD